MIRINIHQAKTHLSRLVRRVAEGDTVLLCHRNVPVAEIRPLKSEPAAVRREVGVDKGLLRIDPAFHQPLPESLLRDFEGWDRPLDAVAEPPSGG